MRIELHRKYLGIKKFKSTWFNGKYYTRFFFLWFATTIATKFKL